MPTLRKTPESHSDFALENHEPISLLRPFTRAAREWIEQNVSREGFQPFWPSVVVERRYIADVLHGIYDAGLAVCS